MPKMGRIGGDAGAIEKGSNLLDIALRHLLLDAVGAQAGDGAGDKNLGLVERVAEIVAGVAADDQPAGLAHERAHVPDRTANDDVDALHRNAAAGTGVAFDDDEPAAARGGGG